MSYLKKFIVQYVFAFCVFLFVLTCCSSNLDKQTEAPANDPTFEPIIEGSSEKQVSDGDINIETMVEELTKKPENVNEPTVLDYFEANNEVYNMLLGYGDETLYQCFVYLYDHAEVNPSEQETTLPEDVIMSLVGDMLKSDNEECSETIDICVSDESTTGRKLFMLTEDVLRLQKTYGDEWLKENCSGFYQLTRAIMTSPDWRFLTDMLEGEVYNTNIYMNANQAFADVLSDRADEKMISDESDLELADIVCNENTKWTITQAPDGTVTMTFEDIASGGKIGEMVYMPDESEFNGEAINPCGQVTLLRAKD